MYFYFIEKYNKMNSKEEVEVPVPTDRVDIARDINKIHEYFDLLNIIIGEDDIEKVGLDGLLTKVLERHEGDFFNAFNTHIAKIK